MWSSLATSLPGGVNNCAPWQTMSESGIPDPSFSQLFHEDFNKYTAAEWTVTNVGVTPTNALTAETGGVLLNTTTAGAADATYLQLPVAGFQLLAGKHIFFKARIKQSDATTSDIYAGLIMTSVTPLAANDGLFFFKATGATTWVLRSRIGGASTDLALPASSVAVNATYQELGFHIDNLGNVEAFFNPTTGSPGIPNAGDNRGRDASFQPSLTQVMLSPSFGIRNGAAAIKTMSIDYITVSAER